MTITTDITFEEFYSLAHNPPRSELLSVFEASAYFVNGSRKNRRQYSLRYKVYLRERAFFHSYYEAEKWIRNNYVKCSEPHHNNIFCFYVTELPYKQIIGRDSFVSCRLYDSEGRLIDRSSCMGSCIAGTTDSFLGRKPEDIRFRRGDIVEFLEHNDEVELGVVVGLPRTIDECWEIVKHCRKSQRGIKHYPLDESDDCYIVQTGPNYMNHRHISSLKIFTPHYPIPPNVRKQIVDYFNSGL